MTTLAEIRQRLEAAESKQGGQSGGDNAVFLHWNMTEGDSCTIRFLPDGDEKNTFFWAERQMIRLPFTGIKGQPDSKRTIVQVPCMEMWGEVGSCPILSEVRPWFKDATLTELGKTYWKKRSYIFQGFVRKNPLSEDTPPENPIRRFVISPQIFQIIKSSLLDPEMEDLPTDFTNGLDFRINKTTKGEYADYSTSTWARKETPLTEEEQSAINTYGLFDLSSFLPNKPSEEGLRVIKEMFEASVDGEPYDPERFGAYYRPSGMAAPSGVSVQSAPAPAASATPTPEPAQAAPEPDPQPAEADEEPKSNAGTQKAEDILAMIRSRQSS